MLWALWVVDLLLDLSSKSSDACLCLLLLFLLFCDSLWVYLCWSLSQDSSMSLILQHVVKLLLFLHLWHFLPHTGHSLGRCDVLHLLHILPGPPLALWPLPFLFLKELILSTTTVAVAILPFDLCQLKSFTVILCSLACWRRAAYVTSSLFFLI